MLFAKIVQTRMFAFLPFPVPIDLALVIIGALVAFLLSYLFTFGVRAVCLKMGWLDRPGKERERVHKKAVPRLGGIAIFLAFVVASLLFYFSYLSGSANPNVASKEIPIYWLLLAASTLIVLVHAYDDVKGLSPRAKFIAQTVAVLIILGPWLNMKFNGVLLYGFSNPFGVPIHHDGLPWFREPIVTLFIDQPVISWLAIPAVLLTWFWFIGMMNTVNLIDGLDGLATGVVGITAAFIAIISYIMKQDTIAILAAVFTGAVFGFLPHNWNPARIFMGDSGSQFLGLLLAVLSIMGGAKVALALMVLGVPILDVAIVIINRIRRGQSFAHYDLSHLHYRLRATGLSVKQICYVFYGLTLTFGIMALLMTRIYKLIGLALIGITMAALIIWIDYRQRQRGAPISPDSPPPPPTETPRVAEPASGRLETHEQKMQSRFEVEGASS